MLTKLMNTFEKKKKIIQSFISFFPSYDLSKDYQYIFFVSSYVLKSLS